MHAVHSDLRQTVVSVDACEDRLACDWVDRAVHEGVEPDEANDLVGEVFGALDAWVIGAAGALSEQKRKLQKCVTLSYYYYFIYYTYGLCYCAGDRCSWGRCQRKN